VENQVFRQEKRSDHGAPGLVPAKILWTGGWDSTFRLLQLLFLEKRQVEPYYAIDENRKSIRRELLTMKRIRNKILETDGHAAGRLRPTTFFSVSETPPDPEITAAFQSIRDNKHIGGQYDWLARYFKHHGISGVQLCIHEDDKAAVVVAPMVTKDPHNDQPLRVGEQYTGTDEHRLFGFFEFPVLDLTKTQMAEIAKEHGWSEIMGLTWFCHKPKKGAPCGQCDPCIYTYDEGLAWRIPPHRRQMIKIRRAFAHPTKGLAARITGNGRSKNRQAQ
jgi:hypothetical protein